MKTDGEDEDHRENDKDSEDEVETKEQEGDEDDEDEVETEEDETLLKREGCFAASKRCPLHFDLGPEVRSKIFSRVPTSDLIPVCKEWRDTLICRLHISSMAPWDYPNLSIRFLHLTLGDGRFTIPNSGMLQVLEVVNNNQDKVTTTSIQLRKLPGLTRLKLTNVVLEDDTDMFLPQLKDVSYMGISRSSYDADYPVTFMWLEKLSSTLEVLQLNVRDGRSFNPVVELHLETMGSLMNLRKLTLERVTIVNMNKISKVILPALTSLSLEDTLKLKDCGGLNNVKELHFSPNVQLIDDPIKSGTEIVSDFLQLESLSLRNIKSIRCINLPSLKTMTVDSKLRSIELNDIPLERIYVPKEMVEYFSAWWRFRNINIHAIEEKDGRK